MRVRVQGAVSDLHTADAMYHKECRTTFMAGWSVETATRRSLLHSAEYDAAFDMVLNDLKHDPSQIWNSVAVHKLYLSYQGTKLMRRTLIERLKD